MAMRRYGSTGGMSQYKHICEHCGKDFNSKKKVAYACSDYCYARIPRVKDTVNASSKDWKARHPEFTKERNALAAITRYYFPETKPCIREECCNPGERHHPNYDKPYEIVWLCHKHHVQCHRNGTHQYFTTDQIEKHILWESRFLRKKLKKSEKL
jgi:hypothetical protein